jgi:hypothetical protein
MLRMQEMTCSSARGEKSELFCRVGHPVVTPLSYVMYDKHRATRMIHWVL